MKRNKLFIILCSVIVVFALIFIISIAFLAVYYKKNINVAYDESLFSDEIGLSSTVFYANSSYDTDEYVPVRINVQGASKKIYYKLNEISDYVVDGFVAVEDRGFYEHSGVDIKRTLLAAAKYISGDKNTFGASTITQQLIKNISGDNEVTLRRKITEILRAYSLEKNHTKSEIMEVYLNVIPMGNGIFGVGAASELYFGKTPSELTAAEAATLIGITNAPSAYNPYLNPDKCLKKRDRILNTMYSEGVIDQEELIRSLSLPLGTITKKDSNIDSWYIETVIGDVTKDYAKEMKISESLARILILSGGYSIYTAIDVRVQNILESVFFDLEYLPREVENGLNYSMVVMDPQNGNILGIIGGVGKKTGNRMLNHATSLITPASALKPIALYAPLLESGEINWASIFDDSPVDFYKRGDTYSEYPHNSPDRYDGLLTVKDAIRYSKNTIAIRLCKLLGVENVYKSLKEDYRFKTLIDSRITNDGKTITDKAISPMALGQLSEGVSLRALTEAYSVFPNYGDRIESRSYLYVTDRHGDVILENNINKNHVFSETTGKIMNQLLLEVVKSGTARNLTVGNMVPVAGKTGTSGDNRDKVFVGYTPSLVASIWCGYDDRSSVGAVNPGILKIWDEIMIEIENKCKFDQGKNFNVDGLIYAPYCMDSGKKYSHNCIYDPRGSRMEYGYFASDDTSYLEECDTHIIVNYDIDNKGVAIICDENKEYSKVSLIKNVTRSFPKEVYITDAEYVYRDINLNHITPLDDDSVPYFYSTLKRGEYVGISNKKRQFNRLSPIK